MNRQELNEILGRVGSLAKEVDTYAPESEASASGFRSDAAGLLVVLTCATYETCVKQTIYNHANRFSPHFKIYAENNYEKINSRIDIGDLNRYSKTFNPKIGEDFKSRFKKIRQLYLKKAKKDVEIHYVQLLKWRHSFAHTGARVTTVEEVLEHHRLAKRVIYAFSDSFSGFEG